MPVGIRATTTRSASTRKRRRHHRATFFESVFFLAIFFVGLLVFLFHLFTWLIPYWLDATAYERVPCTIRDSRLVERRADDRADDQTDVHSDDRVEYGAEFGITYVFEGVTYTKKVAYRHPDEPEDAFFADKHQAETLLARFPVGRPTFCWLAVDDPESVFLVRDILPWGWYVQTIALILILFGALGFWWSIRHRSLSEERRAVRVNGISAPAANVGKPTGKTVLFPTIPDDTTINESPGTQLAFRLASDVRHSIRLIVIVVFSLFWNAASWGGLLYFLWIGAEGWIDHLFTALFGIVFCGFGLFLAIACFQQILQAFGCGPTLLEISDHPLYPGRRYRLVMIQPGVFRVVRFELRLICEEIARFRQGTDTITNRKEVFRHLLFERSDFETTHDTMIQHEMLLRLPLGAMHSMRCESNEILWKLVVHARMVGWPDLYREYPIVVRPTPSQEWDAGEDY